MAWRMWVKLPTFKVTQRTSASAVRHNIPMCRRDETKDNCVEDEQLSSGCELEEETRDLITTPDSLSTSFEAVTESIQAVVLSLGS